MTEAKKQHQELMAAALAQIEHIKNVIERSAAQRICKTALQIGESPATWGQSWPD